MNRLIKAFYIILIIILFINSMCMLVTLINSYSLGDLYRCSKHEQEYIKKRLNIDYNLEFLNVKDNHLENKVEIIIKNEIPFLNVYSGTFIIKKNENSQLYEYIKEKYEYARFNNELIKYSELYMPYKIIYIIIILIYVLLKIFESNRNKIKSAGI